MSPSGCAVSVLVFLQAALAVMIMTPIGVVTWQGLSIPTLATFAMIGLLGTVGHLLIDGPFTDRGFASLAGLEGVGDLDLFWHVPGITSEGFAALKDLPNLFSFAADGRLSDDTAMRHIAAIPRLRALRDEELVIEGDVGVVAPLQISWVWRQAG